MRGLIAGAWAWRQKTRKEEESNDNYPRKGK